MEYLYAAMLLHSAGQKIEETNLSNVLKAASVKVDTAKVKSIVSALDGVDIDKAMATQVGPVVSSAPDTSTSTAKEEKAEVHEEEKKEEEIGGLGALFG